jgi:hypothetical protein
MLSGMAKPLKIKATLEKRGPAGAFVLSDAQVLALGEGRKAFPVRVTVNRTSLELRLARMGGENMIGLARAAREQAGVEIGATYEIEIAADEQPRVVEVPEDLAAALAADPAVEAAFQAMAPSHRKEFARWVAEAKKASTRSDRVAKAVEMVREGRHR